MIKEGPLSLEALLLDCARSAASQPEDKVFALQGISSAADTGDLQPNYNQTFQEVYLQATLYTLRRGSFSLLTVGGICFPKGEKSQELPSWVADLSMPPKLYPLENTHSKYQAGTRHKANFVHRPQTWILAIQGVLFDKVQVVAQSSPLLSLPQYQPNIPGFNYVDILSDYCVDEQARHREIHELTQRYAPDPYHTGQHRWEAMRRTLIGDESLGNGQSGNERVSYPAELTVLNDYDAYIHLLQLIEKGPDHATAEEIQTIDAGWIGYRKIGRLMGKKIASRQFAVTEKGYMALVPPGTQTGDWVAVFAGAATPHILRPVTEAKEEWRVFGDAYVHGLMNGEVFRKEVRGETIVLV
jgi:hypothetical protein